MFTFHKLFYLKTINQYDSLPPPEIAAFLGMSQTKLSQERARLSFPEKFKEKYGKYPKYWHRTKTKQSINCTQCGKEFTLRHARKQDNFFCSRSCYIAFRTKEGEEIQMKPYIPKEKVNCISDQTDKLDMVFAKIGHKKLGEIRC